MRPLQYLCPATVFIALPNGERHGTTHATIADAVRFVMGLPHEQRAEATMTIDHQDGWPSFLTFSDITEIAKRPDFPVPD